MITLSESLSNFSGTTNYVAKYTPTGNVLGLSQIFDNGSNVGIGTASPNSVLQIKGISVDLFDVTNNITNLVKVYSDEVTFFNRGLRINKLFQPFSASDITIYSASNAGVGFSLNIGSDFTTPNTHYTNIIYSDNSFTKRAFTITNTTVSSTGLLELMKDGGNVNIGSTFTNSARVHIQGIDSTSSNFALKIDNSASSPLLYVRNDGNVGIGTSTPSEKLEVNGNIKTAQPSANGAGAWKLGKKVTATVSLVTTDYIEVEIDSVVYKLALVS